MERVGQSLESKEGYYGLLLMFSNMDLGVDVPKTSHKYVKYAILNYRVRKALQEG